MVFLAILEILALVMSFVVVHVWWIRFAARSTEPALTEWQKSSGYIIVRKRLSFMRGPARFFSSSIQAVYLLDLIDKSGRRRVGWACCGSRWGGVFEKPVIVKVVVEEEAEKDWIEPELL
jgi:hypothetical protein